MISVVIPTKNRATLLGTAARSVLRQTWRDLELIIVDDGSTDDTGEVLAALCAEDTRVRLVRHARSVGAGAARNAGVRVATGAYIAFNDDDTLWVPEKLQRLHEALEAAGSHAGIAFSPIRIRDLDGVEHLFGAHAPSAPTFRRSVLTGGAVGPQCVLMRRAAFESVGGFDERLPRIEDWDLWVRLLQRWTVAYVADPLAQTAMLEGGISTSPTRLIAACQLLSRKYAAGPWVTRRERAAVERAFVRELVAAGAIVPALRHAVRAGQADPRIVLPWIRTFLRDLVRGRGRRI